MTNVWLQRYEPGAGLRDMNTPKRKILTVSIAGAVLCLACGTFGQDLAGRWYLGLDTGVAFQQDLHVENAGGGKLEFDPGFRLDVSGGTHLSEVWRAEVELGFIYNPMESTGSDAGLFQVPIMANAIYTVPIHGPISAYVGAGLGGVYTALWHGLDGEDSFTFAYQGIVGVKYAINDNFDVGLSYKLLGTLERDLGPVAAEGALSHSILAAFTFKF